jgi:4-amino-4-deoxy-L-arabinose transferase-like glycosyltransferase
VHLAPPVLAAITFVLTAVVLVRWARRRASSVDARVVAVVCVMSPLSWGLGLGAQLAALAVVCAGSLLDTPQRSIGRTVAAGMALGVAVLARPDAVFLVVVLVVLVAVRLDVWSAIVVLAVALVAAAPWINTVWSAGDAPWLAGSLRTMFIDASTSGVEHWTTWWIALLVVGVALAALSRRVHSPESER